MTNHYETLILANPEITSDEIKALEEHFERVVKKNEGELKSFEKWGKYKLAYPVQKHEYGVYFLSRFTVDHKKSQQAMQEIYTLCAVKFPQFIMRHINTRLAHNAPVEYARPESLEEVPSHGDVDTFLRDNNMNGFIKGGAGEKRKFGPRHQSAHASADASESSVSE